MTVKTFLIATVLVAAASSSFAADGKARDADAVQVALAGEGGAQARANPQRGAAAQRDADTLPGGTALLLACLACIGFIATRRGAGRR